MDAGVCTKVKNITRNIYELHTYKLHRREEEEKNLHFWEC